MKMCLHVSLHFQDEPLQVHQTFGVILPALPLSVFQ